MQLVFVNEENNRICWNLFYIKWHFWHERVCFLMVEPIENVKLLWHCILIFHSSVQLFRIDWIELALGGAIWNTFLLSFPASDTTTVCVVCYCQCHFFNMELQHSNCSVLTGLNLHLVEQYGTPFSCPSLLVTLLLYCMCSVLLPVLLLQYATAAFQLLCIDRIEIALGGAIWNWAGGSMVAQYHVYNICTVGAHYHVLCIMVTQCHVYMHHTPYIYIHHGGTISNGGRLVAQYQILRPSPSATATQYFRLISLRLPPSPDWHWPPTITWSTQNNPEFGVLCRI